MHISFDSDTDEAVEALRELIIQSIELSKIKNGFVWLRNENKKIIKGLQERFEFNSKGNKNSHYSSVEYIMRRENFISVSSSSFDIRGYEVKHIDLYLALLDSAMDFSIPPAEYEYIKNKIVYQDKFVKLGEQKSFEAFWVDNELIGLYWRSGGEIEIMAVSAKHQRKGHGSIILSRAIDCVFKTTNNKFAYLYCVDWNKKGQNFYKKTCMETMGHSFMLSFG